MNPFTKEEMTLIAQLIGKVDLIYYWRNKEQIDNILSKCKVWSESD